VRGPDGEEPTATFVPSWDEADDGADEAEEGPADRDGAGSDDEARWASAADDLDGDGAGDLDADSDVGEPAPGATMIRSGRSRSSPQSSPSLTTDASRVRARCAGPPWQADHE
jgi:hypothetical protein